jgi:hypothetical protein
VRPESTLQRKLHAGIFRPLRHELYAQNTGCQERHNKAINGHAQIHEEEQMILPFGRLKFQVSMLSSCVILDHRQVGVALPNYSLDKACLTRTARTNLNKRTFHHLQEDRDVVVARTLPFRCQEGRRAAILWATAEYRLT